MIHYCAVVDDRSAANDHIGAKHGTRCHEHARLQLSAGRDGTVGMDYVEPTRQSGRQQREQARTDGIITNS